MSDEAFETLMGSADPPLIVLTTAAEGERAGCLVGFHAQSSITPPHYSVWLSKANHTYRVGLRAAHFAVHFLTAQDLALAERFGTLTGEDTDKFAGVDFSLDEQQLYISDTGTKQMHVLDLQANTIEEFATCTNGGFDGFRLDMDGRIWTSAGDGVHVYDPDGTLLGKVLVPETVANVAWGGEKFNRLYICATTSLYAILLPVRGAKTM